MKLLKSIGLLIDTREKQNKHITDWLDKKGVNWKNKALDQGDYSFYIPADKSLNIERDLYYDKEIVIERKNSADELAGNFTKHRARFEEEMAVFPGKKYLLIENCSYKDITVGNYRSTYSSKSYIASLHTFNHRYNLEIVFMPINELSGFWIYTTLVYWFRERLR